MSNRILVSRSPGEIWLAVTDADGAITDLALEREHAPSLAGHVFAGRVADALPEARGHLIDLGPLGQGLLPAKALDRRAGGRDAKPIQGTPVAIQIGAAPRRGKLPRVTTRLAFPGVGLIYRPDAAGDGVSRRISDPNTRSSLAARLASLERPSGGFIARRTLSALSDPLIRQEAARLVAQARAALVALRSAKPGARLFGDGPNPILDALRHHLPTGDRVTVDDGRFARRIKGWLPEFAGQIDFVAPGRAEAFFESSGMAEAVAAAVAPSLALANGGSLLIEPGETLTAVDVNSGSARTNAGHRAVNAAATEAVGKALRLRNLSGLIAVDLVGQPDGDAAAALRRTLERAVASDPLSVRLGALSPLGLFDLARERVHPALHEHWYDDAIGAERQVAPATTALRLLRQVRTEGYATTGQEVRVSPSVAEALAGPCAGAVVETETRLGQAFTVVEVPALPCEQFEIVPKEPPSRPEHAR